MCYADHMCVFFLSSMLFNPFSQDNLPKDTLPEDSGTTYYCNRFKTHFMQHVRNAPKSTVYNSLAYQTGLQAFTWPKAQPPCHNYPTIQLEVISEVLNFGMMMSGACCIDWTQLTGALPSAPRDKACIASSANFACAVQAKIQWPSKR